MTLQGLLTDVIDTFPDYREQPRTGGPWDAWFRRDVAAQLRGVVPKPQGLVVVATTGNGSRAEVPWIGFRRSDSTLSFLKGIYVAFLFPRDRSGVLLSLLQGVGKHLGSRWDSARLANAKKIRSLYPVPTRLSAFNVNLGGIYTTPRAYDKSHICGRRYNRNEIPDEHVLLSDLYAMLDLYDSMDGLLVSCADETSAEGVDQKLSPLRVVQGPPPLNDPDRFSEDVIQDAAEPPIQRARLVAIYQRNKALAGDLKRIRGYRCERCKQQTNWLAKNGKPYVECHHPAFTG